MVKVVVLDDDPTGTQTVHSVPVLTEWSVESLIAEFQNDLSAFYLLTNSRALSAPAACALNAEIGANLVAGAKAAGREFVVVSRSDSTLRGHFPDEVESLEAALGGGFHGWLLIPFFEAGGRVTVGDVHYVQEASKTSQEDPRSSLKRIPVGETEFARDAAFGYRASNLRDWVVEKSGGRIAADRIASLSLEEIRDKGTAYLAKRLCDLKPGSVCIVNAERQADIEAFLAGLLRAEQQGKRFLYRTAASFAAARAGIVPRPLLSRQELNLPTQGGGLTVVGSYVQKTTAQLEALMASGEVEAIEIATTALLNEGTDRTEIARVAHRADAFLQQGRDVVLFTSRHRIEGTDASQSLTLGRRISQGLVDIVRSLRSPLRYLIAKGGITSSDLATQGLLVKRAMVLGQIAPGIPVWRLGPESRSPGLIYIVFPGNVGSIETLQQLVATLHCLNHGWDG